MNGASCQKLEVDSRSEFSSRYFQHFQFRILDADQALTCMFVSLVQLLPGQIQMHDDSTITGESAGKGSPLDLFFFGEGSVVLLSHRQVAAEAPAGGG